MLPFGHIGIGNFLVQRWKNKTAPVAVLLGTLLPDFLDKPLYYIPSIITGEHGAALGLLSGTRTIGHSLLFLGLLLALFFLNVNRQKWWLGLFLGAATHLLLDNYAEPFSPLTEYSSRIALFFPFYGIRFPVAQYQSLSEHLFLHVRALDLGAEILGLGLFWFFGPYRPFKK